MIKINVILSNNAWYRYIKDPNQIIENKVKNFNKKFKGYKKKILHCTLLLSGEKEIKKLNSRFRKKNRSTDVLSFPFYRTIEFKKKLKNDKEIYLGDIIINLNKIENKNNNFILKFNKLWIHGLVHLFGYDHKKDKDFYYMNRIEKKFLSYLK